MKAQVLKGLIVDLDGTLADSLSYLYEFYQTFLAQHQLKGSPAEFQHLNGATLKEIAQYVKHTYHLSLSEEEISQAYLSGIEEGYLYHIKPLEGSKMVLEELFQKGVSIEMATSAKRKIVKPFLERCGLDHLFSYICTGEDVKKGKPDPEIYEKAFQHLNCAKENVCVIEDGDHGIQAALAAGLRVLALNPIFPAHPNVTKVHNWHEIQQELKKQYVLPNP